LIARHVPARGDGARRDQAAPTDRDENIRATRVPAAPLWHLLLAASDVLHGVLQGQPTTIGLAQVSADLRPGTQALVFGALRGWGRAQTLLRRRASRMPALPVRALLLLGLALLSENPPRYDAHTLTDQLVQACHHRRSTRAAAGFVNGCMRQTLREGLCEAVGTDASSAYNLPEWWLQRLQIDHPEHWRAIALAAATPAPLHVRQNQRRFTKNGADAHVNTALAAIQNIAKPLVSSLWSGGWWVSQATPVAQVPGFDEGFWSVQDWGAQQAAPTLVAALPAANADRRLRVLDACAAPGGKTAHLLELADLDVLALDRDSARLAKVRSNLDRLGLQAQLQCADAAALQTWWDGRLFDGILLDAPCTASGIVRRHPDVPWLRRLADLDTLAAQQSHLLNALWPTLAPQGVLLYVTCSVFAIEGPEQIRAFLARNTDAVQEPSLGRLLPTSAAATQTPLDNLPGEHDGFFYALLRKRGSPAR
jgi:16S rRNA (cytosine967-C5)-methyltransferase